jgi:hypothetical protein
MPERTAKQAAEMCGRSESWLRRHICSWCDQTLLYAVQGNCGAIYERCDINQKIINIRKHADKKRRKRRANG